MRSAPVRRLQRVARWAAFGLAGLALACAVPVAWVETACTAAPDPAWQGGTRFGIPDAGYRRPAGDGYLAFPERYVVDAHAELAAVSAASSESAYGHATAIPGFWTSLCGANRAASRTGAVTAGRKAGIHAAGLGFGAGMAVRGAYEGTLGALTAWWRGPEPTAEDRFDARALAGYAAFLGDSPWHRYPFEADLSRLWGEVPFEPSVRSVERRASLSVRYGVDWALARAVGWLAPAEPPEPTIRIVAGGVDGSDAVADPRIAPIGAVAAGDGIPAVLVEIPRGVAFTEVVRGLGERGRTVLEVAGNRRILTTVLMPREKEAVLDGAYPLFSIPVQSEPGWVRIGYDTEVASLVRQIRSVEARGGRFERAYDY